MPKFIVDVTEVKGSGCGSLIFWGLVLLGVIYFLGHK